MVNREVAVCELKHALNKFQSWRLVSTMGLLSSSSSVHSLHNDYFRIDPGTGQIFSIKPLDYEICASYELGIEFYYNDLKTKSKSNTNNVFSNVVVILNNANLVKIDLIDTNDCWPEFDSHM